MKTIFTRILMAAFLFFYMILSGITSFFLDFQESQNHVVTDNNNAIVNSYGLYDLEGKLYHNTDNPVSITDGTFSATCSFGQEDYSGIRNYVLIIMVDFKQTEFEVDGKSYRNYRFSLEDESKCEIEFKLYNLPGDAYEMEYLVFDEPDCMEFSFSDVILGNLFYINTAYIERFRFSSSEKPSGSLKYIEGTQVPLEEGQSFDGVSLFKKDIATDVTEAESGTKICLSIGNRYEEDADFATVAFCNWEQVDILPGEEVFYAKLPPDTPYYYEIDLPKVKENSSYQVVTFDLPFGDDVYPSSSTSCRMIIKGD
ncbi:MAG: hypothetical protein NC124_20190 [Clostridium sp.]|nr:hypothetical protein [Roseburia sp.]MCM1500784.1 hypothetical protein [Clostridium sp.]